MDPFKSITLDVWAGGKIVWTPNVRYTGGQRHKFCEVELHEICLFDFFSWYTTTTGVPAVSPDIYYRVPKEKPTKLKKVNTDDSIREMQKDVMDETSVDIWMEESVNIWNEELQVNENETDAVQTVNEIENNAQSEGNVEIQEEIVALISDGDVVESDVDEQAAEDFEGPEDDDIFVERPENHSQTELRKYKATLNEESRKSEMNMMKNGNIRGARNNRNGGDRAEECAVAQNEAWYTDESSGSDEELSKKVESDDERPEDVYHGYVEFKEKNYPDKKQFVMEVGMLFASRGIYRQVLRDWVIRNGWDLKFSKIEAKRITAKCKSGCNWYIHASNVQGCSTFQVKTIKGEHTCAATTHNTQANYKYLGLRLVDDLRDTPNMTVEALKRKVHRDINVEVSDHIIYRAKRYAQVLIEGDIKMQYSRLWDYCVTVCKENIGSKLNMHLNRELDPPALDRMYFGLKGLRDGFLAGCRPIIGLDGCFLKGYYKGELLCAVGRDANDNLYPIAMAFVMSESYVTWKWFLEILRSDIGTVEERGWAFISDRQKGLLNAVSEIFPGAEHRFCVRHMYNNFKAMFRGLDMKKLFWCAASVGNVYEYNNIMKEINDTYLAVDENEVTPYVWLSRIDPQHWARSHFSTRTKCAAIVNNMSESFNAYIMGSRDQPIISMWEWIRHKLMSRIQVKLSGMEKHQGEICPNIMKKMLKERKEKGGNCFATWAGQENYSVEYFGQNHVVKLDERTCSCGMYQLQGYPCCHAISAIELHRKKLENHVVDWYSKKNYMATYKHMVYPVPGMKFYELSGKGPIQPPVVTVRGGRPQKERKKDGNDIKDPTKASRKGHKKTCSKCLGEGHNYLTCKNPVNKSSKFYKRIRASQAPVSDSGGSQPSHTSQSSQASQAPIGRKLPVWQSKQQKKSARSNIYVVPPPLPPPPPPPSQNQNASKSEKLPSKSSSLSVTHSHAPQVSTSSAPPSTGCSTVCALALSSTKRQKRPTVDDVLKKMKERKRGHHPF